MHIKMHRSSEESVPDLAWENNEQDNEERLMGEGKTTMYRPRCRKGWGGASWVKTRSREESEQMEEHEQRLRGKKNRSFLGEIQVLLLQPMVTSVAGGETVVPDCGRVRRLSSMFLFLHVWNTDSLQQYQNIRRNAGPKPPRYVKNKICCLCSDFPVRLI